jgi:hypothetical protein
MTAMDSFPTSIEAVDETWLSEVLAQPVLGYETEFLEGGVLADAYRLHGIRYAKEAPNAPTSVVLKLPNREDDRREMAIDNRAYLKELRFFRELAGDMPLRSPTLYAALCDGTEDAKDFVLVMEDLTAHSRVFDQVDDTPDEGFVRKIALEVAAMHARYWEAPMTQLDWICDDPDRYTFPIDTSARESPERLEEFRGLWSQTFGYDICRLAVCPTTEALTSILCGSACGGILDRIYDILSQRPRTLVHSDLRADNIFRTDPARGLGVDDSRLTYIDWQLLSSGPPGPEFTQAWQHSLPPEVRRKDRDVLRQYHERLVGLQPAASAYTYDMLVEDYVLGFVMWWAALVTVGANTLPIMDKPEGARMKRLWGQGIPWMLLAMEDHDCLALVKRLADGR